LLKESAGFGFLQALAGYNVVEKFAALGVFHDQKELPRCLDYLKKKQK